MVGSLGATNYHNFRKSLEFSHNAEDLPLWKEVYNKAFPSMVAMINHRQDGEHQRAGIDRSVILANSKQILVDEKVRRKNYGDIALEYWSDVDRKKPGWVCKPLRADYIAYAIAPAGLCYLLPVIQLQQAWVECGDEWIEKYFIVEAPNKNNGYFWTTVSVAVPPEILFPKMGKYLRIDFKPTELDY